jgi:predicted phosphodiesterase
VILGLISDIHGNTTALNAVIADAGAVDAWWVLGDLVALGPDPVGVIDVVLSLPNVSIISGNTERYVIDGDRPYPALDDVRADPDLLGRLVEVAVSFAWTRGAITQAGHYDWLAVLPSTIRMDLPDGTRLLGVHASPGSDDGPGIDTHVTDSVLIALLDGCEADVVIGGHTHDVTDRVVGGIRAVNLGSVSNSNRADRCATYALLHIAADSHRLEPRVVEYDHTAELDALESARHPASEYVARFHRT